MLAWLQKRREMAMAIIYTASAMGKMCFAKIFLFADLNCCIINLQHTIYCVLTIRRKINKSTQKGKQMSAFVYLAASPTIHHTKYIMCLQFAFAIQCSRLSARCHFRGPEKLSISRAQAPPNCHRNGSVRIKNITHGAV
jgi:hypothetical protein